MAEDTQKGDHPSMSGTISFQVIPKNDHSAAFSPDPFYGNRQQFSPSKPELPEEHLHQTGPLISPINDLHQVQFNMANSITPEKMQSSKVDLGPHASIVVREWELLWNTAATVAPVYVDTDYIGIAKVAAVSK